MPTNEPPSITERTPCICGHDLDHHVHPGEPTAVYCGTCARAGDWCRVWLPPEGLEALDFLYRAPARLRELLAERLTNRPDYG